MKLFIYPFLLVFWLNPIYAQFSDDFSDGNFSHNPTWFGQDSLFVVNASKQLQSKAHNNHVGERILWSQQNPQTNMEWRIWLRFAFNPSSQNQARWIISATSPDFKNCYYVQLGGSTGTTDSIGLYKEVNGQKSCLIAGRPATVGKTNNLVQLRVLRDSVGNWQLFSDTTAAQVFISEGTAHDTSMAIASIHGIWFRCTAGNVANFYADNVYAGPPITDKIKPQLVHFEMLHEQAIKLVFSEKIESLTPEQIWFSQKQEAAASSNNQIEWQVQLNQAIIADSFFVFGLNQIYDLAGNSLDTQLVWAYHVPLKGEILVTELLPDPEPIVQLPNAEFVEIYNHSRFPIWLKDFTINDPSSTANLPNTRMNPHEYIILCAAKDTLLFKPYGKTIGLHPWPSLNNSSDSIQLKFKGELWQEIAYNLSYYQSKEKENGGYSLSLINPFHLCWAGANWTASKDEKGGTPGIVNDVWVSQKDTQGATFVGVDFAQATQIELQFNTPIIAQNNWKNNLFLQGILADSVVVNHLNSRLVNIYLAENLQHKNQYRFEFFPIVDCLLTETKEAIQFTFLEPIAPKQNDLLISEIYYDESRLGDFPQKEFIEIYNRTEHPIQLENMMFSDANTQATFPRQFIMPKSYLIVCHQSNLPAFSSIAKTVGLSHWPSLNTSDVITIKDSNGLLIHQVAYADSWLKNTAKNHSCSIEMIDLQNPCGGENNWKASTHFKGASLGEKNSVATINTDHTTPQLLRIYVTHAKQLQLQFSEILDSTSLVQSNQFKLNPNVTAKGFYFHPEKRNQVYVNYADSLQTNTTYTVALLPFSDCALNLAEPSISESFQIPQTALYGDLVVNELLFNPSSSAYDFIEILNISNKHLDLTPLQLARLGNINRIEDFQNFAEEGIQLAPQEYIAISQFPAQAQNNNFKAKPAAWVTHSIPAMNDDEGTILLLGQNHLVVDSVYYSDKMHLSFLRNTEGVSLEKINPFLPGHHAQNWTSAAETEGFSSPTKKNSQQRFGSGLSGKFSCNQSYFSPNADGINDLLSFEYKTGDGQWLADLLIYNLQGKLVKEVCKSKLLASSGEIHWIGDTNWGERAPIGNYIAYWNCYSQQGETEQQKIVISLLSN